VLFRSNKYNEDYYGYDKVGPDEVNKPLSLIAIEDLRKNNTDPALIEKYYWTCFSNTLFLN
jgi:hypothetical protein